MLVRVLSRFAPSFAPALKKVASMRPADCAKRPICCIWSTRRAIFASSCAPEPTDCIRFRAHFWKPLVSSGRSFEAEVEIRPIMAVRLRNPPESAGNAEVKFAMICWMPEVASGELSMSNHLFDSRAAVEKALVDS